LAFPSRKAWGAAAPAPDAFDLGTSTTPEIIGRIMPKLKRGRNSTMTPCVGYQIGHRNSLYLKEISEGWHS
jgi:hypothetical protein